MAFPTSPFTSLDSYQQWLKSQKPAGDPRDPRSDPAAWSSMGAPSRAASKLLPPELDPDAIAARDAAALEARKRSPKGLASTLLAGGSLGVSSPNRSAARVLLGAG